MKRIFKYALLATIAGLISLNFCIAQTSNSLFTNQKESTRMNNSDTDLEKIRERIISDLLEPAINAEDVRKMMNTIQPDGTWPDINYKDVSRTGFEHSRHLQNMLEMSRALKKKTSPLFQNKDLKEKTFKALNFWLANDFICENWWWNEMGTPNLMINTLLVLDSDLTEEQKDKGLKIAGRANLKASGARPGGDLIQIAGMLGKQALFTRNETILDTVVQTMASEIKITTGRGLKPDLSFHHRVDNVISTLAYGTGYASSFSYWAVKIAGTKYRLPEEATKLLIDYYIDGISQSMVHRMYPDPGAKNRGITRKAALHAEGISLPQNLLKTSSYRSKELEEIIRVRKGEIKPSFTKDRFFWHSSYFSHQRPAYFASVRMHSDRANNMEQPHNDEGIQNHHYGDGSNFISITGKEYVDIFPVWDWQKIPGTTILQKAALPHWKELAKKGKSTFSGAVTNSRYSVVAFDFTSVHDPLKARKAWFFFDDEYVCLGTSIEAGSSNAVFTTINQCLLNNDVIVKPRNQKSLTMKSGMHDLNDISWVHHDGVAYIFPAGSDIKMSNLKASGNWRRVNHQAWATEDPVTKDVFTLWFDHGVQPTDGRYEYKVVPGMKASAVEEYQKKKTTITLSNTEELQAVQHPTLGLTQIVFYKPGKIKISEKIEVTATSPCILMIKTKADNVQQLAISDPTHKLKNLSIYLSVPVNSSGDNWKSIWNEAEKISVVDVNLPIEGYAGRTVIMEIKK